MSVMLGDKAVTTVWKLLDEYYRGSDIEVYKYEKGEDCTGNYIAINHLPFVHRGVIGEGIVNVNIHVKAFPHDKPDVATMQALTQEIVALFPEDKMYDGAIYELYCDSRPTPDRDNTYYINLQIKVIFNNLNYE